ncbi:MAG: metal-sensing transcriptional repressor, partial [Firmicutes bacterium]|nr:metal-sensing transcriptional repressor [Bacillota bacterium]
MKAKHSSVERLVKTARGQLDGVIKMIEEDRYCIDISNQILAAEAILHKANQKI